jgi:hypothetical protein
LKLRDLEEFYARAKNSRMTPAYQVNRNIIIDSTNKLIAKSIEEHNELMAIEEHVRRIKIAADSLLIYIQQNSNIKQELTK